MVGGSNILTVSYGTFSCTLEGFDEPFSTMKAIAEYFRDLAAEDRYFGAEPPTPDAEMLHRIAEREIHRRVEAKINSNGNGVVLRPEGAQDTLAGADSLPSSSLGAHDITVSGATEEELSARGIPARAVAAPAVVSAVPPAVSPAPAAAPAVQNTAAPVAETVAAKLQRIRTALAEARERESRSYSEDQHAQSAEGAAAGRAQEQDALQEGYTAAPDFTTSGGSESDFGYELDIAGPITQDEEMFAHPAPSTAPPVAEDGEAGYVEGESASDIAAIAEANAGTEAAAEAAELARKEAEDVALRIARRNARRAERAAAAAAERAHTEAETATDSEAEDLATASAQQPATEQATPEPRTPEQTRAPHSIEDASGAGAQLENELMLDSLAEVLKAEETPEFTAPETTAPAAAAPVAEVPAPPAQETPVPRIRARVIKVRRADDATYAAARDTVNVFADSLDGESEDETEASIQAVLSAATLRAEPAERPAATRPMPAPQDQDDDALLAAISAELGATTPQAPPQIMAPLDAEIITDVAEDATADPASLPALSADAEQALAAELAALEDDWDLSEPAQAESEEREAPAETQVETPAGAAETPRTEAARALAEGPLDEGNSDVTRLMNEANTKIERPENRRRFSAIAHLKAAVAATVADRKLRVSEGKMAEETIDTTEAYRADLTRAVRPRRPESAASGTARPESAPAKSAPLVLVSEQRVDEMPSRTIAPVRPRRISTADLAARFAEASNDADSAVETPRRETGSRETQEAADFADFAEKLGATGLADLLEAAAAYSEGIEGRPHFSRPQIIRKVAALTGQSRYDREAGLRSFGALLREGKIEKVKRGQFAITQTSRFFKEARRAGA